MLDRDIRALDEETSRRSLDGLEARIWEYVDARARAHRRLTIVMSCQAAVLATGVLGSIVAGQHFGVASSTTDAVRLLRAQNDLAPSSRLIGR